MDVNNDSHVRINNRTSARTFVTAQFVSVVSKVILDGGGVSAWHKVFNVMLWFLLHDWQVHACWWSHLFVVSARRSVYTCTWTECKHAEFQLVWNSLHARRSCTMNAEHITACLHDVDIHACQWKLRITATFVEVCALCGCSWLTLQCYMLCAFIRKMFCAMTSLSLHVHYINLSSLF